MSFACDSEYLVRYIEIQWYMLIELLTVGRIGKKAYEVGVGCHNSGAVLIQFILRQLSSYLYWPYLSRSLCSMSVCYHAALHRCSFGYGNTRKHITAYTGWSSIKRHSSILELPSTLMLTRLIFLYFQLRMRSVGLFVLVLVRHFSFLLSV